jgi:hypothetical protein
MSFRVLGLDPRQFRHLQGLSDAALSAIGARRCVVDAHPGFPDRTEIRDLDVGETAILLNDEHQPSDTPDRSRRAIFIREGANRRLDMTGALPDAISIRPISLRAFDTHGEMVAADIAEGLALTPLIHRFLARPDVACLHAHDARRSCYAALVVRT